MTLHHDQWALVKVSQCGCRINTDRFPKWSPKAHASRGKVGGGVRSMLQEMFCFLTPQGPSPAPLSLELWVIQKGYWPVPFRSPRMKRCKLANYYHYLLKCPKIGKKKLFQPFTRFQLGMFYSVIYLFWKIWLVSLKLTLETGVNLKTSSSSGSNHFHTKLRGILWFTVYNQTDKPGKLKYSRN